VRRPVESSALERFFLQGEKKGGGKEIKEK